METLGVTIERAGWEDPVPAARLPVRENAANAKAAPKSLRVLMAGGGTGGHIFPALAVAEELRARWESRKRRDSCGTAGVIEFLGTSRGLESRLIPAAGFRLHTIAAAGLKGIGGWKKLRNLLMLPRSAIEAALVLREFQPDVVVGMGGYLAGPAMLEAALNDIATLLIEPNALPGFTNRLLAPVVRLAAVGFDQAAAYYGPKARVTGHPVRKALHEIRPKEHVPPFTVFIFGGSQGSAAINDCVVKSLALLLPEAGRLRVIHQTGERDYNAVCEAYQQRGITAELHAFVENIPEALARADLIISRAGATAVAELAAAGKASLLIPFPAATDHHQLENARALERVGAARVIEQVELTPPRLVKELWDMLSRPDRLAEMERRARTLSRPDAAGRIADLIEDLAVSCP